MLTIYETNGWSHEIKRREMTRETTHCFFYRVKNVNREYRENKSHHHHRSYSEARASIVKRREEDVARFRYSLDSAEKQLAKALLIPSEEPL